MAGKRHHIIPQFLQKGFASRIEGKTIWTWHYLKGTSEPREIGTRDAIVSEHFYGKGELNADSAITEFEQTKIVPLLEGLRNGSIDPTSNTFPIAELIGHFCIRTKTVRKTFESMSKRFFGGLGDIYREEEVIWDTVAAQPESFMAELIKEALSNSPIFPMDDFKRDLEEAGTSFDEVISQLTGLMKHELGNEDSRAEMQQGVADAFGNLAAPMQSAISGSIKESHIRSLKENVAPDVWTTTFEKLSWNVQVCKFDVILGDSGIILRSSKNNSWMSLCEPDDVAMVVMPISRNKILIGHPPTDSLSLIDKEINAAIASCSCEQFVAVTDSGESRVLISLIGSSPEFITDEQIANELGDIRGGLKPK